MKKYRKIILLVFALLIVITSFFLGKSFGKEEIYLDERPKQIKHENTLAMMLETEAGSGNYEMTTRSEWPTDGYIFNTTLSKCENGGELSWDNENKRVLMSGNISDRCYVYFDKVLTLAAYIKSQYTGTQGENSIYYHNGTITSDDGTVIDAGDNSYRYAGASDSVNNFVCFGSDESTCPTDNLYRIIGVFGDQVKLIKYDYATSDLLGTDGDYYGKYTYGSSNYKGSNYANIASYYWNKSTQTNTWSESLLNKTNLNANFITNIGTEWANKIATTTWKVGGNAYANIYSETPSVAYQNEIKNPSTTASTGETEYSAQIGLMYVSDYGFATEPSAWSLTMSNYDNTTATSTNWMYMGLYEWTISRDAIYSNETFTVNDDGYVDSDHVDNNLGVRPSFSLLSSIDYVGGSGTQSDPIIIN